MKQRITNEMRKQGKAWAVRSDKFIDPSDGWGAKPMYHVHPDVRHPHQDSIRRFKSLRDVWDWLHGRYDANA